MLNWFGQTTAANKFATLSRNAESPLLGAIAYWVPKTGFCLSVCIRFDPRMTYFHARYSHLRRLSLKERPLHTSYPTKQGRWNCFRCCSIWPSFT